MRSRLILISEAFVNFPDIRFPELHEAKARMESKNTEYRTIFFI
jgi:hypothetical protein